MTAKEAVSAIKEYMDSSLCVDGSASRKAQAAIKTLETILGGYWGKASDIQARQAAKGIREYGQRLEDNTALSAADRLIYLEEELVDAIVYIEHIKAGMECLTDDGK